MRSNPLGIWILRIATWCMITLLGVALVRGEYVWLGLAVGCGLIRTLARLWTGEPGPVALVQRAAERRAEQIAAEFE